MSDNEEPRRNYTESDADMRTRLRTMYRHYQSDIPAFVAVNPNLGGTFGADWLAAIGKAEQARNIDVRRGELHEQTEGVTSLLEKARTTVQSVFYFVGEAFPKNAGRLQQYGKDRYEAAYTNHGEMSTLLDMAVLAATRDKDKLAEQGFSPDRLADLTQLAVDFKEADTNQEVQKGTNTEGTDDYITLHNKAFAFAQQLSKAAKVAFSRNPAKRAEYRLADPDPDEADPAADTPTA